MHMKLLDLHFVSTSVVFLDRRLDVTFQTTQSGSVKVDLRRSCLLITLGRNSPNALCRGGGADGSFLLFPQTEPLQEANDGTEDTVNNLLPFLARHNVTAGDLIQFAGGCSIY
jgi:hypothetical protein